MDNTNQNDPLYQLKSVISSDNKEYISKMAKAKYKVKHEKTARNFNNLDSIGEEMNRLAKDDTKNEKMGIIFRTISDNTIMDLSVALRMKPNNKLLDSETLKDYAGQYLAHVETIEELKGKEYFSDILIHYYPLDVDNKIENIPSEDKFIEAVYEASPNINNLIKEIHVYN